MPKLVRLNKQYKDKGLVMILVSSESRSTLEPYAKKHNITWPIAIEPTKEAGKAYGVRGIPAGFLIAPSGKIVWEGHPAKEELEEAIKKELPNVKKGGGSSENPAALELKEGICKSLKSAVKKAAKGDLAGALKIAKKLLDKDRASDQEKEDAQYVVEQIEARAKEILKKAEDMLGKKMPYEARGLLLRTAKALRGTEYATEANEKIKEIDSDESLKEELKAGKIFAKGAGYEAKGKEKYARKYYQQVIKKYPESEYARRAKEKL